MEKEAAGKKKHVIHEQVFHPSQQSRSWCVGILRLESDEYDTMLLGFSRILDEMVLSHKKERPPKWALPPPPLLLSHLPVFYLDLAVLVVSFLTSGTSVS